MTSSQPQGFTLDQRVSRLENREIDLRLAVSSLIETVNLHQTNFETMQRNFEAIQRDMDRRFEEVHAEIRGLQAENRRILDYLLGQRDDRP